MKRDDILSVIPYFAPTMTTLKQTTTKAEGRQKKKLKAKVGEEVPAILPATVRRIHADAREMPLAANSVDLIVTSPPYWQKRDYGFSGQFGQEPKPQEYVQSLIEAMQEWQRVLKSTGSVFLNIGDTYYKKSLAGIPGRLEAAACDNGWKLRNRIIWAKEGGMPDPAKTRLVNRHEYIFHFTKTDNYYYDIIGYSDRFGTGSNPGDVWNIPLARNTGGHLAPFPDELVERAILLACPKEVCSNCGHLRTRLFQRTAQLDLNRPQARRATELAIEKKLTAAHIAAIQATGISDAGKALKTQTGTGKNSASVQKLAAEAKLALGGYFREFTFAKKETIGWATCGCNLPHTPGVVLDPFMGTGTTLRVASAMGRSAIGVDLAPEDVREIWGNGKPPLPSKMTKRSS